MLDADIARLIDEHERTPAAEHVLQIAMRLADLEGPKTMRYKGPVENLKPPAESAHLEWHVLTDADRKRHRLRYANGMWSTDTAQIMTAEQAYRLAWNYVGPARG